MQKFAGFLKQIRFKIFWISSLLPITAVLLLGLFAYRHTVALLTDNEYERIQMLSKQTDDQLNQYLFEMRIAFGKLAGELVKRPLTADEVVQVLEQNKYGLNSLWQKVYFITNDLDVYLSGTERPPDKKTIEQLYRETVQTRTDLLATGPYLNPYRDLSISMIVRKGTQIVGVLAADINLTGLNDIVQKMNYDRRVSMILYNKDQLPVLSDLKMKQQQFENLLPSLKQWLAVKENLSGFIEDQSRTRYLVTRTYLGFNDFSLVYFIDENSFLAKIESLKKIVITFMLVVSIVIVMLSFNLSRYISEPIHKMIKDMNKIKNGELGTRIRLTREDEFLTLSNSFNDMLDRIETLIVEKAQVEAMKKQFELKALQAQINPHFLFNTLNSINSLLDLKRTEKIPDIIHSLVHLFEYTLEKYGEFIDIRTELRGLKYYTELLQIRYANKFRMQYEIDEGILHLGILKMTLQPIVENAVFHGIKESTDRGLITVGGYVAPNKKYLVLYVEDNGVGISPERLSRILKPDADDWKSPERRGFNSIGLRNVHERLQLHFGNEYGLTVISRVGEGTRVEIRYPVLRISHSDEERVS